MKRISVDYSLGKHFFYLPCRSECHLLMLAHIEPQYVMKSFDLLNPVTKILPKGVLFKVVILTTGTLYKM